MPSVAPLPPEVAAFYAAQSDFSDPGDLLPRYADLPTDRARLARTARDLLLHRLEGETARYAVPTDRLHGDAETRYLDAILRLVVERNDAPLTQPRPVQDRFVGICRDFALLYCSFLRHVGVPARLRYGFADYFDADGFHHDHVVTEYWDERRGWLLADPQLTDPGLTNPEVDRSRIDFDPMDVRRDRFRVAGAVWRAVREGAADPARYGVAPGGPLTGEWFVAGAVQLDLAMLNKAETLLWDVWGAGADSDAALTDPVRELYDRVAEVTADEVPFDRARHLYLEHPGLRLSRTVLSLAPFHGPSEVTLR